jgi:hypothetical protein
VNNVTVMKRSCELVKPSLNNCLVDISDSLSRIVAGTAVSVATSVMLS